MRIIMKCISWHTWQVAKVSMENMSVKQGLGSVTWIFVQNLNTQCSSWCQSFTLDAHHPPKPTPVQLIKAVFQSVTQTINHLWAWWLLHFHYKLISPFANYFLWFLGDEVTRWQLAASVNLDWRLVLYHFADLAAFISVLHYEILCFLLVTSYPQENICPPANLSKTSHSINRFHKTKPICVCMWFQRNTQIRTS